MAIGRGSLQRAANAAAKVEETKAVKTQAGSETNMWLAYVNAALLCDIPDQWRGPKYVRPNVSMLAESVSRCGILEPLPVVQTGKDAYQLVGGSRRMEVIRMLGIEAVPVVILPGNTLEDAKSLYDEMRTYTDAAQDTMHNAKFRTAALFGSRRVPEYLL